MKKLLLTTAAFTAASTALFAQSLNITAPGYSGGQLFGATPGFVIEGLAAAPGGDVFYLERHSTRTLPTKLYSRSAGDGYGTATELFNFGAAPFGSFALWKNGRVFFGENSTGVVRVLNPDLTTDILGIVPGNYDAAFAGGSLFLSHNPGGQQTALNKISRYELVPEAGGDGGLMLGPDDVIVDTPNDFSGPLEFDAAGGLLYGGTFRRPGLHRFTDAQIAGATGATSLGLNSAQLVLAGLTSAYFAVGGPAALWQSDFGSLNLIDPFAGTSTPVGDSPDYGIGQLDSADSRLFVAVTNSFYDHSAVFLVVPEPGSALLLTLGVAALTTRRRRRID